MPSPSRLLTVGLAAAALFTTSACGGGSAAEGPDESSHTLTIALQESYASYLPEVALQQGYFKSLGITDVKVKLFTSLPAMFAAVQKNQLDFGMQTLPALASFNQTAGDNPLKIFETFGTSNWWYVRKGSGLPGIKSGDWQSVVKSWKGRTIGVPAKGSIMEKRLRAMLTEVGLNPDRDVQIAVAGVATSAAALEKGVVDVVTVTPPNAALVESKGIGDLAVDDESGPAAFRGLIATSSYFASSSALGQRSEFYGQVATAMEKARAFTADPANEATCVSILTKATGLSQNLAQVVYRLDNKGVAAARVDRRSYDKSISSLVSVGIMKNPTPSYTDMVAVDALGTS
jgi:ABC-type nitrate/sulfonate/bicarbonate transport system substrate-binding protein